MRYQVVTYNSLCGSDEMMDYTNLTEAIKEANKYQRSEEYAAVYDRESKIAFVVFGDVETPVFSDWVKVITIS